MNSSKRMRISLAPLAMTLALAIIVFGARARAQETSSTTVKHGPSEYETTVRNAEVVYVAGNDLVIKNEDGSVEHLVVPDSDMFHINGKEVTVHDLTPGTKLTETIITKTTPRMVTTVATIEGKVWHVSPPHSVIVTLPDGTNKQFKLPADQKVSVNGRETTAFELKKGMKLSATVVTDSPETVMEQGRHVAGQTPPPATPPVVGVLLFSTPRPAPVATASAEPAPERLPKTGTLLPLVGLIGLLSLGASFVMRVARRSS